VANGASRGMLDIPASEAMAMDRSGQMPRVVAKAREALGPGGRYDWASRLKSMNDPTGQELEQLLSAEAATGKTVDSSVLANGVYKRADDMMSRGTVQEAEEVAPGLKEYADALRKQSRLNMSVAPLADEPNPGLAPEDWVSQRPPVDQMARDGAAPKSVMDVWAERKSLDKQSDFGRGKNGLPRNPDPIRSELRGMATDQMNAMVDPSKHDDLAALMQSYDDTSTAGRLMTDAADRVGSRGGVLADLADSGSARGHVMGRGVLTSMTKPALDRGIITIARVADWAQKKLMEKGENAVGASVAGGGASTGSALYAATRPQKDPAELLGDPRDASMPQRDTSLEPISGSKLARIFDSVKSSPDPEMEDYLYREMYPEYGAAMTAAEDELKKSQPQDTVNVMSDNMRKLQGR